MTWIRRSAIAFILAGGVPTVLAVAPVGAHSGGRAQLYVDSVRLEPQAGGWRSTAVVRDADSGRPEPGFGVQITGSGPGGQAVGPVGLTDPDADGTYAAVVPPIEGRWALTVEAAEIPGGARAEPFTKTWPVTLQAGQPLDLAGSRPPTPVRESGGGHSAAPSVLGLTVAAALAGLVSLRFARRGRAGRQRRSVRR
ncbi:MAG TPA: hypothetical protein VG034_18665 [Acidimicrobiia bacterium]|jgi:hypothetical protein|nr:hypothetical protein [Acidimicrobiia bacterium]